MDELMWRKSRFSMTGECVQLGWRKSSHSGSTACVELTANDDVIYVRDSKDPTGPVLTFTRGELRAFLSGAKAGEFDDLT